MNDRKAIANDFDLLNNYRLTKNETHGREVHRLSSNYAYISELSAIASDNIFQPVIVHYDEPEQN